MPELLQAIEQTIATLCGDITRPAPTPRTPPQQSADSLRSPNPFRPPPQSIDLAAEDLRLALRAIGRVTGRVDVEDLLDVIFRDFCIGK